MKSIFNNKRINDTNIIEYIKEKNNLVESNSVNISIISEISPLLQNDYGDINDCVLTSITSIILFLVKNNFTVNDVYDKVLKAAKGKYSSKHGVFALHIPSIFRKVFSDLEMSYKSRIKVMKPLFYNYKTIKDLIDRKIPITLTMPSDGRSFYKHHAVTIIGYKEYTIKDSSNTIKLIAVYDNWSRDISYVDYDKMNIFSSICYVSDI